VLIPQKLASTEIAVYQTMCSDYVTLNVEQEYGDKRMFVLSNFS